MQTVARKKADNRKKIKEKYESCEVLDFIGQWSPSGIYRFDIRFVSGRNYHEDVFLPTRNARLMVNDKGSERIFNGELAFLESTDDQGGRQLYRAVLLPRAWNLMRKVHNRIFRGQSIPNILQRVLSEAGFRRRDFDLELSSNYVPFPYCLQYREKDFDFVNRLLVESGLRFYLCQKGSGEKLIITDSNSTVLKNENDSSLFYYPAKINESATRSMPEDEFQPRENIDFPQFDHFPGRVNIVDGPVSLGILPDGKVTKVPGRSKNGAAQGHHFLSMEADRLSKSNLHPGFDIKMLPDGGVALGDGKSEIVFDRAGISLKSGGSTLSVKRSGEIEISGENKVTIQGRSLDIAVIRNLKLTAGSFVELQAQRNLVIRGFNITSEAKLRNISKGNTVRSEAQGVNEVKGALVKMN